MLKEETIQAKLDISYLYKKGSSKKLYILLHGYLEKYSKIYQPLKGLIPNDAHILAPNGIFPIPIHKKKYMFLRYAWYFFDSHKKKYYVNHSVPVDFIISIIQKLNLENMDITIIGHSQGGYLAPFVAKELKRVNKVIMINAQLRHDLLGKKVDYEIIAINAAEDTIVDPLKAKLLIDEFREFGNQATFYLVQNTGHEVSLSIQDLIKKILFT